MSAAVCRRSIGVETEQRSLLTHVPGTLKVHVSGDTLVPPNLLGRFSILCAILRQLHLTLALLTSAQLSNYDYVFVDQLSACIPLFRLFSPRTKILFYCHFPDYLLTSRQSLIKSLYRIPFDWLEAATTGLADTIVVNSAFTKSVFADAFPQIQTVPRVVYPCVSIPLSGRPNRRVDSALDSETDFLPQDGKKILLSINRFERKKNIDLAIRAFAHLTDKERTRSRLVIAGGYDSRVSENVAYHAELVYLCEKLKLKSATSKNFISSLSIPADTDVLFLLSIPASLKSHLLKTASLLCYTPAREHFGIVPLEAMLAGVPVLAHNSGGPLETVSEGVTGWLRPAEEESWAAVMRKALFELQPGQVREMGRMGKERVVAEFSKEKMAERLDCEFDGIVRKQGVKMAWLWIILGVAGVVVGFSTALAW